MSKKQLLIADIEISGDVYPLTITTNLLFDELKDSELSLKFTIIKEMIKQIEKAKTENNSEGIKCELMKIRKKIDLILK